MRSGRKENRTGKTCRPLDEALGNSSAAGGVERGLEMGVGRCGWEEAKGFRSHEPDTWSTNGRKDREEKKDGREGRKEEAEERRKKLKEEGLAQGAYSLGALPMWPLASCLIATSLCMSL